MDAVAAVDPESTIDIPANLTLSSSFNTILLVPTIYCDEVTYWVDIVTAVSNPVTVNAPDTI